ncbi:MAG TPA: hypothetical protein VFY58_08440 [Nocardioides sp.]|nr:hypothetical protein [Nocardioides sp.]
MRTKSLRGRGAKSTALLSAAVLVASGIAATMGVANAAVTRGPGENASGTPNYYRDANGMALELCLDGTADVQCEPPADDHLGIYFAADANVGPMTAIYGVEAVLDTDVTPAEPIVINGARFRFEGARPNTTYTIKDPWRTTRCRTDGTGSADCRRETTGDFAAVRNGHVTTFLRSVGPSAAQFIGTHTRRNQVTGSPSGFNRVVVTGGGQTFRNNRFSVMGQKRDNTAMSSLSRRALELGNGRQTRVVSKSVRYSSIGTANARPTVRKGGQNAAAFRVTDNCGSQAPGTACNITVTFRPRQHANSVKRAFLVVDDNGLAAPRRVSLKGIGS